MTNLTDLISGGVYTLLLIFMRFGTAMMLLPGFGDVYVPATIRFLLIIGLSFILMPLLQPVLPAAPDSVAGLTSLIFTEVGLGIFIGTVSRFFMASLEIAGTIISMQTGLSSAAMFNPQMQTQGTAFGTLMSLTAVMIIFATNLHHMLLRAVLDSYNFFPPGTVPNSGDLAATIVQLLSDVFIIGVQMSAPFIVLGFVFFWGLGLLARLMPQVQVFLIAQPIQILVGLVILGITISVMIAFWLDHFTSAFLPMLRTGAGF